MMHLLMEISTHQIGSSHAKLTTTPGCELVTNLQQTQAQSSAKWAITVQVAWLLPHNRDKTHTGQTMPLFD